MKIGVGTVVRIEYELRVQGGDVLESSEKTGPLEYVHGQGRLLPALEKRLEDLGAGDAIEGLIPAAEIAPPLEQLPTRVLDRKEMGSAAVEMGSRFEAQTPEGTHVTLEVTAFDADKVTVRLVPPLAGKDIAFKVKVIRIEDPRTHTGSAVKKPPPPLPAEALKLDPDPEP